VLYQQQAQACDDHVQPSGDGPDLTALDLPAADGIMLLAAHISRHGTLTEWLDASILDESDPTSAIRNWTCTTPTTPTSRLQPGILGPVPPGADRSQSPHHRVGSGEARRIESARSPDEEFGFVVHAPWQIRAGWIRPSIQRTHAGTCYLGDPSW